MEKQHHGSIHRSSGSGDAMLEYPDDGGYDIDHYPLKRRQRRQRLRSLHSFNSYVARTGIVAVAASASLLTRQMENIARVEGNLNLNHQHQEGIGATFSAVIASLKSYFGCAVGSIAARLGELASSLADAIGEPPQRVLAGAREDQDLPTALLFFAINFCVLCTVASMFFFIFSFCANPEDPVDANSKPDTIDQTQLVVHNQLPNNGAEPVKMETQEIQGILRVLSTFSLALVAGGGLGVRHTFQSALLCGC